MTTGCQFHEQGMSCQLALHQASPRRTRSKIARQATLVLTVNRPIPNINRDLIGKLAWPLNRSQLAAGLGLRPPAGALTLAPGVALG